MSYTRRRALQVAAGIVPFARTNPKIAQYQIQPGPFSPDWESLKQYKCPDWFRDAKLGIWAVWGPESVPEQGDWYARHMYIEGHAQYKHHVEHYGHPSQKGYKDIIPLWKAERWEPERLMQLYKDAGARYFVAIGNHHDNFDCWNSKHHRWNPVNFGPKKDIIGIWRKAALKFGLRFGVTEHNARSWSWFNVNKGADKEGPYKGVPYDGNDPKYQDLYFPPHQDTSQSYPNDPPEAWKQQWFLRTKDLIDANQPDLMYFDGGVPFGEVGRRIVAHMYNQSVAWHNGNLEAIFNIKNLAGRTDHGEFQEGTCVLDVERGVVNDVWPNPWQTDTCIGDWYYKRDIQYKSVATVVHMLADIVSKNGNLLLNIPPKPDGTLDAAEEAFLNGFAPWMKTNGEAIYGTRPWKVFGEGPNRSGGGYFGEDKIKYSAADVRFTTKGPVLYAILLGWPEKEVSIKALAANRSRRVSRVEMLGVKQPLKFSQNSEGLQVEMPAERPGEHAFSLKISGAV